MRRHMTFSKSLASQFASLLVLLVASFGMAVAQTGSSTVGGAVQDAQGAAVSGAKVTLKNANDQQDGTAFSPVIRVSPDTVEEFRVTTVNANSTQGRSSGAQVGFITKSGSNTFHGNLYEYEYAALGINLSF